jgi:Zn finger protein HypA/HybF involved in hydrogenase expression
MNMIKKLLEETSLHPDTFKTNLFASLGFDAEGKPLPIERKTCECDNCHKNNAYVREEHPDTDMNEMVVYCPDCKHTKEI